MTLRASGAEDDNRRCVRRSRAEQVSAGGAPLTALVVACDSSDPPDAAPELVPCDMPAASRPTVVLVHGAWADTSSWDGKVASLRDSGYEARAIANPLEDLTTDAASVADFLTTISAPIVLVGHSYGGSVITNAAAGNPQVKALVYVDAAAPDVGETTAQLSGTDSVLGGDPASLYDTVADPDGPAGAMDLYLKQDVFVESFGSDLPRTPPPACGPRSEPPRPARS